MELRNKFFRTIEKPPVYIYLLFLAYEFILRVSMNEAFWGFGIVKTAFLCLFYAVSVYAVILLTPTSAAHLAEKALLVLAALLYISQLVYYSVFKTFYSLLSASRASQIFEFKSVIARHIVQKLPYLIMYAALLTAYFILSKRKSPAPVKTAVNSGLSTLFGSQGVVLLILVPCLVNNTSSFARSLVGQGDYNSSTTQVGMMATMHMDFLRPFFDDASPEIAADMPDIESLAPTAAPVVTAAPVSVTPAPAEIPTETPTAAPVVYGDNVLNFDFSALSESDKDSKQLYDYFASVTPSRKNAYTGMFAGYNLIFITAEGFSGYAVDKELTPTLYKLVNDGFRFTNFYNPLWGVSTSDGEYVACTGLLPKEGVWSFERSSSNYLPFSMGNQLGKLGYKTMAYHNHTYSYYGRNKSHPNMGYEYKAQGKGLDLKKTWPESDLEMMEKTVDEYIGNPPFHAYYMTVSGHLQYNFSGNYIALKNRDKVAHLPYSEAVRAYLACQIELDMALEYLLERLEQAGEKTLIVLSADHYPYGLTIDQISELAGHEVEPDFELYKSALIIYAGDMVPQTVDKLCSSLDILPTVSNLLGLEYDSRLLMGRDILSTAAPLVIFSNRSFITDIGSYNSKTDKFTPSAVENIGGIDEIIPAFDYDKYQKQVSQIVDSKFAASKLILEKDFYRNLYDRLNE